MSGLLEALTIQFVDLWSGQSPLDSIFVILPSVASEQIPTYRNHGTGYGIELYEYGE